MISIQNWCPETDKLKWFENFGLDYYDKEMYSLG